MCREDAVLELAAPDSDIRFVQMWVCDLVMSRSFILAIPEIILFADTESIAAKQEMEAEGILCVFQGLLVRIWGKRAADPQT